MCDLGLAEPLPSIVRAKYSAAKDKGALTFSETKLAILQLNPHAHGNFQLRYCPALQKKPVQNKPKAADDQKKKFNPFEDPDHDLLVAEIPRERPTHRLVLNKYPVIPSHFILATKVFAEQTDLLDAADLGLTYAVLNAWDKESSGGSLYAFFNSGPDSGASQPHRHLQFVPFEDMQRDVPEGQSWNPLVVGNASSNDEDGSLREVSTLPELPFQTEQVLLRPGTSADEVYDIYRKLVEKHAGLDHDAAAGAEKVRPRESYNLGMTSRSIAIARRTNEAYVYTDENNDHHPIAVNGTILAGTLMVKGEQEWNWLRGDSRNLQKVLSGLGLTRQSDTRL